MQQETTGTGALMGVFGGLFQYLLQIHNDEVFITRLIEASFTALVCGAAGWLGQQAIMRVVKWNKDRKQCKNGSTRPKPQ
jgi:hypothetical protein